MWFIIFVNKISFNVFFSSQLIDIDYKRNANIYCQFYNVAKEIGTVMMNAHEPGLPSARFMQMTILQPMANRFDFWDSHARDCSKIVNSTNLIVPNPSNKRTKIDRNISNRNFKIQIIYNSMGNLDLPQFTLYQCFRFWKSVISFAISWNVINPTGGTRERAHFVRLRLDWIKVKTFCLFFTLGLRAQVWVCSNQTMWTTSLYDPTLLCSMICVLFS